jgi:hypothetical protein
MSDDSTLGSNPTEIPPEDLSGVFAPSSRSAGLGGRLSRPSALVQVPDHDPGPSEPAAEAGQIRARRSRSRPGRKSTDESKSSKPGKPIQVVAYVPVSLKERLRKATVNSQRSFTTVTLLAIDTHKAELAVRWQEHQTSGSSFVGWSRTRRYNEETMVPVPLRLVPEDNETLTRMWQEAGATNRSAYIEAALDLYLSED